MNRRYVFLATLVTFVAVAAVGAVSIGATSGSGAIANITPGNVKILAWHSTAPNPANWAHLGQLSLPVGSWLVTAHFDVYSQASIPTAVDCFLTAPNAISGHDTIELGDAKGINGSSMSLLALTNAPNGGSADVYCRLTDTAADRKVFARSVIVAATSVDGVTVTRAAPSV
ncbi:MAG TPA: hypothetical protein VNC40_14985 [Gaiellaceae bacterium]|nr:hypothetical protein [Gaiellaceae bacterium]